MFGNRLGWLISLVIAVVFPGGIFILIPWLASRPSPPQGVGMRAATLTADLPISPRTLIDLDEGAANAGDLYRQAIEEYLRDERTYDRLLKMKPSEYKPDEIAKLKAIELILKAGKPAQARIYADHPEQLLNYQKDHERTRAPMRAARQLGRVLNAVGWSIKPDDPQKAKQWLEVTFAFGLHLYEERLVWEELDIGLAMLSEAVTGLQFLAKDRGDSAYFSKVDQFTKEKIAAYDKNILPTFQQVRKLKPFPGDIFALAEYCKDPLWRNEATLVLGMFKYNVEGSGRYGDRQYTFKLIDELIADPDTPPAQKVAAQAAKELTIEQFRVYAGS